MQKPQKLLELYYFNKERDNGEFKDLRDRKKFSIDKTNQINGKMHVH